MSYTSEQLIQPMNTQKILLEKLDIGIREVAKEMPGVGASAEASLEFDYLLSRMILELRAHVLALPKSKLSIHKKWPKDWWQAFKDRWFPIWAKRQWPVRYECVSVEQQIYYGVCPHIASDPFVKHAEWMIMQREKVESY